MAMEIAKFLVVLVVMLILLPLETTGQTNCQNEVESLSTCYDYIAGSARPSSECCSRLGSVVRRQPECLCDALSEGSINRTRALGLPEACNVHTPSSARCQSPPPTAPSSPSSGYSAYTSRALLIPVLTAALCAGIFTII